MFTLMIIILLVPVIAALTASVAVNLPTSVDTKETTMNFTFTLATIATLLISRMKRVIVGASVQAQTTMVADTNTQSVSVDNTDKETTMNTFTGSVHYSIANVDADGVCDESRIVASRGLLFTEDTTIEVDNARSIIRIAEWLETYVYADEDRVALRKVSIAHLEKNLGMQYGVDFTINWAFFGR